MNLAALKFVAISRNMAFEVHENVIGRISEIGINYWSWKWAWFHLYEPVTDETQDIYFNHIYSQNNGKTVKSFRKGWELLKWLKKLHEVDFKAAEKHNAMVNHIANLKGDEFL